MISETIGPWFETEVNKSNLSFYPVTNNFAEIANWQIWSALATKLTNFNSPELLENCRLTQSPVDFFNVSNWFFKNANPVKGS